MKDKRRQKLAKFKRSAKKQQAGVQQRYAFRQFQARKHRHLDRIAVPGIEEGVCTESIPIELQAWIGQWRKQQKKRRRIR